MTIVCPSCANAYRLDPDITRAWRNGAPCDVCKERPKGGRHRRRSLAIAAGVLALSAGLEGLVVGRGALVAAFPALLPLYTAAGLDVPGREFSIDTVASRLGSEEQIPVLFVEGTLRNTTAHDRAAPRLAYAVRDAAGQVLYHWTGGADEAVLRAGATARFSARLAAPPAGASDVLMRLSGPGEPTTAAAGDGATMHHPTLALAADGG